tara:strand:+ start:3992 stop:5590 length:1599 start_codon:yes stop_codon:yes gene_type:complete
MEGQTLSLEGKEIGHYTLLIRIGGGGFGEVYRAEHTELGNPFAVKLLHPRLSKDPQFVERFRHEAMLLARLQHENVVQVVDFGEAEGLGLYLVMEWLEGRTLHRVWRQKRVLPMGRIYTLFSQLLDALQLAHDNGIVHRDMKPENLMMIQGARGRTILKIVDFGIATILRGRQKTDDPLNKSGMAIGTPFYMSPEQAAGRLDLVDHRSDLYACGVILCELLTGKRLFRHKDPKEILRHHIESPTPTLKELNPTLDYPDALQGIIDRALAKRKSQRYKSASEFYEDLAAVFDAEGIQPIEEEHTSTSSQGLLAALVGDAGEFASQDSLEASTGSQFSGQRTSGQLSSPSLQAPTNNQNVQRRAFWGALTVGCLLCVLFVGWRWNNHTPATTHKPTKRLKTSGFLSDAETRTPPPTPPKAPSPPKNPLKADTVPEIRAVVKPSVERRPAPVKKRSRKRRRRRYPTRTFTIKTTPSRAKVYVNGRYKGRTPLTVKLRKGRKYRIIVRKKGYERIKWKWRATRNKTRKIRLIEKLF